jgi:hypothetical protein
MERYRLPTAVGKSIDVAKLLEWMNADLAFRYRGDEIDAGRRIELDRLYDLLVREMRVCCVCLSDLPEGRKESCSESCDVESRL